ncbi:complex I NDUFA9 subunit family protein [Shumkonia mesophila]|uniref:complex I NDUFA9 subunit family protein n=1 Tax=Shumkonia mesophila TaxID=2838854 RepID=UPI0029351610|nr:complex I NDUFA9 subunit family protein [Shumkonia mesophila]
MSRRVVTVFGASGFLGRHLVKRLVKEGFIIRAAVRDVDAALFLKTMGDVGQVVIVQANIANPASVAAAIEGADAAVNLVGILVERGRRTFQRLHADGPAYLAAAAARAGLGRLVQVSAIGADAESESAYARTKASGEAMARTAFPEVTVVRPSVVFGPEDRFFNLFAAMTRCLPALPLIGGGATRLQPVYAGDVAQAICRILASPETRGQTYELGGPKIYTFRQLMEMMLAEIHRRRPLVPVPFAMASIEAWFLEKTPWPLLTRDQVKLLKRDNVVASSALSLDALGIAPTPLEAILPTYLARYRPAGAL